MDELSDWLFQRKLAGYDVSYDKKGFFVRRDVGLAEAEAKEYLPKKFQKVLKSK